ncbi:MAG TPA: hypothetical protein VD887_05300 [Allosphingosinicella sp.]|nr:hypothetical protein [Allosphingosinicella sp.]
MLASALMLAAAFGQGAPAASARGAPMYLSRTAFDCLVRNIAQISREAGDPLVIDLGSCPPQVTARLGFWPDFRVPGGAAAVDSIVILTQAEIACIRANRRRPDRLRQPAGAHRYRISLAPCRR